MELKVKRKWFKPTYISSVIEEWRDIPEYEGMYAVSSLGRIRSLARTITRSDGKTQYIKGRIMRPALSAHERYLQIPLSKNNVRESRLVHALVALTFIGERPEGFDVDHINENTQDNRIENLRYLSITENRGRACRGKLLKKNGNSMEHNPRTKSVVCDETGEFYPCAKYLSQLYGVNYSSLRYHLQRGGIMINNKLYRYGTIS